MSDHAEIRELLELAAVEPGGLDRLEAGDTAEAAAVVGHLAGCPDCLEEMARLRRAETLLRPLVAAAPDPALRERTLALVRAVGVVRGGDAGAWAGAAEPPAPGAAAEPPAREIAVADAPAAGAVARDARPRRRRVAGLPAWAASLAAVFVIGLLAGGVLLGGGSGLLRGPGPSGNGDPAIALDRIARETAVLEAAGDAREMVLLDAAGVPAGHLVLSASAGRLLVTATGLAAPAAGAEYRCWVEVGGERRVIGSMWRAGEVTWWAGDVALPASLPPGVVYGVSLVQEGATAPGSVVLSGEL